MAGATNLSAAVFIPELWLPEIQKARENNIVAAKRIFDVSGMGEVKSKGDVLHIPKISNLSASNKTSLSEVTISTSTETEVQLTIDSHKVVRYPVEDITRVQSAYDLMAQYSQKIGYALAKALDSSVLALYSGLSQTVGATASSDPGLAYTNIVRAFRFLDGADAPSGDRSIIVDSWGIEDLRLIDKFVEYDSTGQGGNSNPKINGKFGSLMGTPVFVSENLQTSSVVGGTLSRGLVIHKEAFAYATQMNQKLEMYRNTPFLRDEVFGQELYGVVEYRDDHGVVLSYPQA